MCRQILARGSLGGGRGFVFRRLEGGRHCVLGRQIVPVKPMFQQGYNVVAISARGAATLALCHEVSGRVGGKHPQTRQSASYNSYGAATSTPPRL